MYDLLINRSAERDLRRLPGAMLERISEQILALREDPRRHGVRKLAGALEGWRIRVGDYRVLYRVDDDAHSVTIVRVKHRREVCR